MLKVLKTALIISIAGSSAFAQYFPVAGDKQVVFGITGNGASIMLRKFKTETVNNRYGIDFLYGISSSKSSSNGVDNKGTYGLISGGFSFGKQKNFNIGERFSPYLALDINLNMNSNFNNSESVLVDSLDYNKYSNSNTRYVSFLNTSKNATVNAGIAVLPVIGFNYYLAKNFALGAECRLNVLSFNYAVLSNNSSHHEGSRTELNTIYDPVTGNYTYSRDLVVDKTNDEKSKSSSFSLNGSFNPRIYITASFYFK